jgi:hypothetical protein
MAVSQRTFSRAVSRTRTLTRLCAAPASLICAFYKNISRYRGPSRKRAHRRHEALLSCSGGRVARNILSAQPTRLPLQLLQFFVYLSERACSELFTNVVLINGARSDLVHAIIYPRATTR